MKIYDFSLQNSQEITNFNSNDSFYSRILKDQDSSTIGCVFIKSEGNIGLHQAPCDQLFIVISGNGWVKGQENIRYEIQEGEAAFWKSGESHESGSQKGMTVVIIESASIDPNLKEKQWKSK